MKHLIFVLVVVLAVSVAVFAKDWKVDKPLTIAFLLDETGSMQQKKDETIIAFNDYLDSLKEQNIQFILCRFNSSKFVTSDITSNLELVKLNKENYCPNSYTPLYDAIMKAIKQTIGSNILFVILTDGLENDSTEYTKNDVLRIIEKKTSEGWTFIYLGANQNAWIEGTGIGISSGNVFDWDNLTITETFTNLTNCTNKYIETGNLSTDNFFQGENKKEKK